MTVTSQPKESSKNPAEHWNYQSPRLQDGGVSWQPSIILLTVWGTIFLAVQNVCRMLNYFLYHNTGCKVSRFLSHSKRKYWKIKDSSKIVCLRVQHYWFNLRVSVSSAWGSRFARGVCRWWPSIGCPHRSPPRCCPLAVPHLPFVTADGTMSKQ